MGDTSESKHGNWAVGITTYNRPDVLEFTLSQFDKFGGDIVVIDDHSDKGCSDRCIRNKTRLGIARSKNKCIELLKDYDRIFLFDDDCFPIKDKWWEVYQGEHHFVHAHHIPQYVNRYVGKNAWWNGCLGCCMMIDQTVLKECGGMDTRFGLYGFEHVEYSQRIYRSGLIPYPYITPKNITEYIWSMDAQGGYDGFKWSGFHNGNNWVGASTIPEAEKNKIIKSNEKLFNQTIGSKGFMPYVA